MKEVDESVKFAWAYLLTHGKLTSGTWTTYGGWEDLEKYRHNWGTWEKRQKEFEEVASKAVSVGIDWDKTDIPSVSSESEFNDTESPNTDCLATLGKLVLKNGETFLIGSKDDDAAHLVETARELIKGKESPLLELANKL